MIQLDDVSKIYRGRRGEVAALANVSLQVERGEFVVVRGPSGCGKSTLLLTVGGMVRPSSGSVTLAGENLYGLPTARRARLRAEKIGFVFQMFHLIPYLDAMENVLCAGLAARSVTADGATGMLDRLGLGGRVRHTPGELSTGERQRVALARALITAPEVILADEPTGNLDPDNARQVLDYLAEYNRDGGTVLVVTHDPLADEYAGRTLLLQQGRIVNA
jgi:putative ABC transport system ATP-binding protein